METLSKNRLEAFSDGVFAIIITLLVLEITVPTLVLHNNRKLLTALSEVTLKFLAFGLSFFIIAIYWVSHHRMFDKVENITGKIVWLNLLSLLFISLLPYTTALIGDYYNLTLAVFIYSFHLFLLGLIFNLLDYIINDSTKKNNELKQKDKKNYLPFVLNLLACLTVFIWIPATYILLLFSRIKILYSQLKSV